MINRRQWLLGTASLLAAMDISADVQSKERMAWAADAHLGALLDRQAAQILMEFPEWATSLGLDTGKWAAMRHRLNDRSAGALKQQARDCATRLHELRRFDRAALTEDMRTTLDAALTAHEFGTEGPKFQFGDNTLRAAMMQEATPYVVTQMTGSFFTVPEFLNNQHPIISVDDVDAYLARLEQLSTALDAEAERLVADRGAGVVPPAFVLDTVVAQMAAVLDQKAADTSLVNSLARRAAAKSLGGVAAVRATRLVEQRVFPALQRQLAQLRISRTKTADAAGIGLLPDGERYYDWLLRVGTTTTFGAEEIHRLGKAQSAQIEAQMDTLLRKLNLAEGSVGERMAALGTDRRFLFSDDDAGRAQAIAYANRLVDNVRARLPELSNLRLQASLGVERVPSEIEAGAAGAYVEPGALDGSRPSIYSLNLRTTSAWPKWALPTLTYHETLPGHVWQEALGNERRPWPLIRSLLKFNAYSEGWAMYAEQLADEIGLYGNDPGGRLGYLQAQQLRASRLVVDTGLHAKAWQRDRAIAWMVSKTGRPYEVMASEVDRYCVIPGQACGYMVGQQQIVRLRDQARSALGNSFALQAFNDWVLTAGNLPMTALAELIKRKVRQAPEGTRSEGSA